MTNAARLEFLVKVCEDLNIKEHDEKTIVKFFRACKISEKAQKDSEYIISKQLYTFKTEYVKLLSSLKESNSMLEHLLAPPLVPGTFLEVLNIPLYDTAVAAISSGGSRKIVQIAKGIPLEDLVNGHEILLNTQGNCIVALIPKDLFSTPNIGTLSYIDQIISNDRVSITDCNGNSILLHVCDELRGTLIESDRIRWNTSTKVVQEKFDNQDKSNKYAAEDVKDTATIAMGGVDNIRDGIIKKFIYNIGKHDLANKYNVTQANNNLLLEGPPGCGKTLLARIISSEIKKATHRSCRLRIISGSELYNPYVGATEQNIISVFRPHKDFEGITVIFLDELDAIGQARGITSNIHGDRFLSTLLSTMEGYEHQDNVITIAATNRKELIDPALLERFATVLRLDRPNRESAIDIFKVHIPESIPMLNSREEIIEATVNALYAVEPENAVAKLVLKGGEEAPVFPRDLISGRLIEQISNQACERAFQREVETGTEGVIVEDFEVSTNNAIHRLSSVLNINNVHTHLSDMPMDLTVVSIRGSNNVG